MFKLFFIGLLVSTSLFSQGNGGLNISVAVDLVGHFNIDGENKTEKDRIIPRSAEVMFFAPVDSYFEGVLSFAAHNEAGLSLFEIHEAYLSSATILPAINIKGGQFFLNIGRLGRFHQHDWPFITTPIVFREFFGNEGIIDSGLEVGVLLPSSLYLDLTLGVTNGYTFGHSHDEGKKPKSPISFFHLLSFFEISEMSFQPGLSGLWRADGDGREEEYLGLELTGKTYGRRSTR